MAIKILFTADNHFGISYSSFPKAKQELLNERVKAFERMVEYANANEMNYFIIGGDLFDKPNIAEKKIKEIATILEKFNGDMVVIIPGNHDFYETTDKSLWSKFNQFINPEKIVVLNDYEIFDHEIGEHTINFFPACCRTVHSKNNMISWINEIEKNKESINIGIAHGNVTGLGIDEGDKYFNMTENELKACNLDLWLLGHIHVPFPKNETLHDNPRIFMAGTHMPDSWKFKHDGNAWHIEINQDKKVIAKKFKPSEIKIEELDFNVNNNTDLDSLKRKFNGYPKSTTALRLNIKGRLDEEQKTRLIEIIKTNNDEFLTLEVKNNVTRKIDAALINQHYPNASLPHVLLSELLQEDPEGLALQKAFEILQQSTASK
jgi:DNA repair exonuclease SbcCD nuclease subunit